MKQRSPSRPWTAERWAAELDHQRFLSEHTVYFVQYGAGGLIKIGVTRDIDARLKSIQPHCPMPLHLLGWTLGGFREETRLHKLFNDSRAWGEWFRPTEDIIRYVAEHTALEGRPPRPTPTAAARRYRKSKELVLAKTT